MNIIEENYKWNGSFYQRAYTDVVIIHHSATTTATPQQIHNAHINKGWSGIAYHYFVRKDGSIYRGRPENVVGGHTSGENYHSIGICFEGNFEIDTMSEEQLNAGRWLISDIKSRYDGIAVAKHKDFNLTACPGANFPFDEMLKEEYVMRYNKLREMPDYSHSTIQKMISKGYIQGSGTKYDENGLPSDMDLSMDMIRIFVTNDRAGLYD